MGLNTTDSKMMYVGSHVCTHMWTLQDSWQMLKDPKSLLHRRQAQEHSPKHSNSETCTRHGLPSLPAWLSWT